MSGLLSLFRRFGVFVAVPILVSACAGRPDGVLVPQAVDFSGTSRVEMLVATTRAPSEAPGQLFSGERGPKLSLTEIAVSIPPASVRQAGEVQWPRRLPADPAREFVTLKADPIALGPDSRRWVRQHAGGRRVLVFVHGFNNRYEDAVYRFAQIAHDSGTDAAPVLFTWPSRASIFDYNYDKESTNYSRDALEETLRTIAASPEVGEITILAHSMGTWLVMESLRQMAIRDKRLPAKIRNVVLASPDLDVDVFARQFGEMGARKPTFTLFVARDDRALRLSRRISGNVDRLGQVDPTLEPYRSQFEAEGITVLDLTALRTGDRLNHAKFAESPEVVKLIGSRLIAGQTITDSDVGLGERLGAVAVGAAATVGNTASAVVSAPIAIIDPATRRTYGHQLERIGHSVGNTVGAVAAP